MTARSEVITALLEALSTVDGLRPATPMMRTSHSWSLDQLAIDVDPSAVEVRVVAMALPLPPLLTKAGEALAKALVGTPYAEAKIKIVVADVDGRAFEDSESVETGP